MSTDEPTVAASGIVDDFSYTATQAALDRKRTDLLAADDRHVWVVSLVHQVLDPMADPDTLSLDIASLVQIVPLHCLGCRIGFRPGLLATACHRVTQGPF